MTCRCSPPTPGSKPFSWTCRHATWLIQPLATPTPEGGTHIATPTTARKGRK